MVFRKLTSNGNEKIKIKMTKLVYLGLSMLENNKTLMYEFWYGYIEPSTKKCKTMLHGNR